MQTKSEEPWVNRHDVVASLINKKNVETAVELGVAFGGNSENILLKTKVKKLYGIDPYKNRWTYNDGMNKNQKDLDEIFKSTIKRLNKYGERYTHIRKNSIKALEEVPNNTLDFVYVDADHSYIGCLNDLRLWVPRVKNGCIIAGDDYGNKLFPGVKKAVDQYFGKLGLKVHMEEPCVWWVKKQPLNKKLSYWDQLFTFNQFIRKIHFYTGELYNATLGKILYKTKSIRKKIKVFIKDLAKKILPEQIVNFLKDVKN